MGAIYYLIPPLFEKDFKIRDCLRWIKRGKGRDYFRYKVFCKKGPVGGIKIMYQHCLMLQELGYDAHPLVMGNYTGNYFGYDIEVKYINDVGYDLSAGDVIVSPEITPYLGLQFNNCTKVLFNQSQSWLHYKDRLDENDKNKTYLELGYNYVINCSEQLCRMLELNQGIKSVAITNGIDQNKFFPVIKKRVPNRVLALSRKNPDLIRKIIKASKRLNYDFCVVDGLTEKEIIDEYQKADIFLATGYPEGLPLPQLEAMNCGCVVIGFSGGGGDEYMINGVTSLVVDDGDCEGVVSVLGRLEKNFDLKEKIRSNGYEQAKKYTLKNMKNMLKIFYEGLNFKK